MSDGAGKYKFELLLVLGRIKLIFNYTVRVIISEHLS
jgi:hypothetical protein